MVFILVALLMLGNALSIAKYQKEGLEIYCFEQNHGPWSVTLSAGDVFQEVEECYTLPGVTSFTVEERCHWDIWVGRGWNESKDLEMDSLGFSVR